MAYPQEQFIHVDVDPSSLLGQRRTVASKHTITYQLDVLKRTGRYSAFELKWHPIYSRPVSTWPIPDHQFWDSDIGKWIEGACYYLNTTSLEDPVIEQAIEELVQMICAAQHLDGYLNIHYSVVEPGMRFTNIRDMHELYNAGHLIEAALAHQQHYKNGKLLDPICKYVDLLCSVFGPGPGQIHGYPGHPEIELALVRLYYRTEQKRYLDLATYFITERGNPTGVDGKAFYTAELARRGDHRSQRPEWWPESTSSWYAQAHKPVVEQTSVEGHSVRAMYLYTAVADLVRNDSESHAKLGVAMERLWNNMVGRKMYMTGGIGAIKQWEGFGMDYFLPQSTEEGGCYAETCAAIGAIMWAERLLQSDLNRKYSDIMELVLYNAVLTAMSADGKGFTYVNQLGSGEGNLSVREEWFTVCCCPPNILRLLGHIGGYMFTKQANSADGASISIHLYTQSTLKIDVDGQQVELSQTTDWPLDGAVKFSLKSPSNKVTLKLRVPSWSPAYELSPPLDNAEVVKGYLTLPGSYLEKNPNFMISFSMMPRRIYSHPLASHQMVAVARGPIVYCAEDVDNDWVQDHFKSVILKADCDIEEKTIDSAVGGKIIGLEVTKGAYTQTIEDTSASPFVTGSAMSEVAFPMTALKSLTLVPYYYRSNRRGRGQMRVGFKPTEVAC